MTVKEHYDNHLGYFYSWMTGDFENNQIDFQNFFVEQKLLPQSSKVAIDLGAGRGVQSVVLAKNGYSVKAIDFNVQLLKELTANTKGLNVEVIDADMRNVGIFCEYNPELIVCCGDTIAHLDSKQEMLQFITTISHTLSNGGKFLLSFRDYSVELTGDKRFIPVKSDDNKILTCILDYQADYIIVTDLLHEKIGNIWNQKVSSYKKVRITTEMISAMIEQTGMKLQLNRTLNGMTTIIAQKNASR